MLEKLKSSRSETRKSRSRRRFLGTLASSSAVVFAGCSGFQDETQPDTVTDGAPTATTTAVTEGPPTATTTAVTEGAPTAIVTDAVAESLVLSSNALRELELAESTRQEFTFTLPSATVGN